MNPHRMSQLVFVLGLHPYPPPLALACVKYFKIERTLFLFTFVHASANGGSCVENGALAKSRPNASPRKAIEGLQ